jgi:hypothetical protein
MKKLLFIAAISSAATFSYAYAQTDMNTYAANTSNTSKTESGISGATRNATGETINAKAIKNFAKVYREASTAEWSQLKDKGFMCSFLSRGILSRAYYGSNGSWLYTIASYQEAQLPKNIRGIVKSAYYDYTISFVNEINLSENRTIYLVQIQFENMLKVLRVTDDEMEVIQELKK